MNGLSEKQTKRLAKMVKFNEENPDKYCWSNLYDIAVSEDREERLELKESAKVCVYASKISRITALAGVVNFSSYYDKIPKPLGAKETIKTNRFAILAAGFLQASSCPLTLPVKPSPCFYRKQ